MDQDSTKGSDKRNWRERLGIGTTTTGTPSRDLPRIGDEFQKKDAKPAVAVSRAQSSKSAPVKPAPMAPRAASKAGTAPVAPDRLAERLRSQRDAQAKLAEQRVQLAKQRSDSTSTGQPTAAASQSKQAAHAERVSAPASQSAKPKFTFAEEEQSGAPAFPASASNVPPLTPSRPPLGATPTPPVFQPRTAAPPPPFTPPGVRAGSTMPGGFAQPGFPQQQPPAYRPIDPATGFPTQPPGYLPPRPAAPSIPAAQQNGFAGAPRLNLPGRPALKPSYQVPQDIGAIPPQGGFGIDPRLPPRMARPPAPAPRPTMPMNDEAYGDDQYYAEQPEPRTSRRSAADYQQAYRDMEDGYEEDAPRSRGPWILLALLLLALGIAAGAVWFYLTSVKPMMNGKPAAATTEEVPVVDPPAGAAKVEPEPPAATAPEQAPAGKKRIYDRIVGDQEVLGGEMAPTEEVPLAPADGSSQLPDPVAPAGDATGEDAAPLPIPPPPGDGNTQGSLPEDPNKQSASLSDPAAGDSQAAVVASEPAPAPPAPGETVEPTSADGQQEAISDEEPVVIPKKKLPVKPTKKKTETEQNLGSKPVVLVPPKKKAKADPSEPTDETTASVDTAAVDDAGLYGDTATSNTAPAAPQPAPVKKKKTLADLFNGTSENEVPAAEPQQPQLAPEPAPAPAKPASAAKPKAAPEQPAETQVATASGYAAQLASFRTKQEASAEFSRLKSKHGAILQGFSPIVSEAQVAGSTRYRLAVGGMASKDQANALCSKLIAAGERDCIVKRQ